MIMPNKIDPNFQYDSVVSPYLTFVEVKKNTYTSVSLRSIMHQNFWSNVPTDTKSVQ